MAAFNMVAIAIQDILNMDILTMAAQAQQLDPIETILIELVLGSLVLNPLSARAFF